MIYNVICENPVDAAHAGGAAPDVDGDPGQEGQQGRQGLGESRCDWRHVPKSACIPNGEGKRQAMGNGTLRLNLPYPVT